MTQSVTEVKYALKRWQPNKKQSKNMKYTRAGCVPIMSVRGPPALAVKSVVHGRMHDT